MAASAGQIVAEDPPEMPYPEEMIAPMRDEVAQMGAEALRTAEQAQAALAESAGTSLFFVNSVCGCAAGCARPGLGLSLQGAQKPDRLYTVFAGNDVEATAEVRKQLLGFPPSSPCIAIFKDGHLAEIIERHDIQGLHPEQLAENLKALYARHC